MTSRGRMFPWAPEGAIDCPVCIWSGPLSPPLSRAPGEPISNAVPSSITSSPKAPASLCLVAIETDSRLPTLQQAGRIQPLRNLSSVGPARFRASIPALFSAYLHLLSDATSSEKSSLALRPQASCTACPCLSPELFVISVTSHLKWSPLVFCLRFWSRGWDT